MCANVAQREDRPRNRRQARGVGRGIALELAKAGADVAVNFNQDKTGAAAPVDEIIAKGRRAIAVAGDVSKRAQVEKMFQTVLEAFGRLDILVNNAGIQTWKPLLELAEADWDRVLATNLKGSFLCTQQAGRIMQADGGAIINIGSGCNKIPFRNLVDYTASKGGLEMFTKVAAVELGRYRIRVNCVAPGAIEIERTKKELGDYAGMWGQSDSPWPGLGRRAISVVRSCFWAARRPTSLQARPSGWTAAFTCGRFLRAKFEESCILVSLASCFRTCASRRCSRKSAV